MLKVDAITFWQFKTKLANRRRSEAGKVLLLGDTGS